METVNCDVCGSSDTLPFLEKMDRFGDEVFQYQKCLNCGLIYLNPRPTQTEIPAYYPENYDCYTSLATHLPSNRPLLTQGSLEVLLNLAEKYVLDSRNLLDVGCGTGEFLHVAQLRGWKVKGVELVENAASIARNKYGLDVHTGSIESEYIPENAFDLITMWDVLEHLPSPRKSFTISRKKLSSRGYLLFSIPNLNSFDRYVFGSKWIGWDAPRHFNLLDSKAVERLVQDTGYDIILKKCVTGAKGTFLLNIDGFLGKNRNKKFDALISMLFWPYRKLSYLTNRAPIITYLIQKQN